MAAKTDMKSSDRLIGQSALQAYRSDLPLGGIEPTKQDGEAIMVATILRQSAAGPADDPSVKRIRAEAVSMAAASLGESTLRYGCSYDDHSATSDVDIVRLIAQRSERSGRLQLAQHLLDSARELSPDPMDSGRILSDTVRVSRKRGLLDLSQAQTEKLSEIASRLNSQELTVRALTARTAMAQTRGNLADIRRYALKYRSIAKAEGFKRFYAAGTSALGMAAAMGGDYNDAIKYLWTAYRLSSGEGVISMEALTNLAQTLLLSGHPQQSRRIGLRLLNDNPPLQTAFPVLGGIAVASARLGDATSVEWASAQVRRLARVWHHPRDVAAAFIECARAQDMIGRDAQAGVLRRRAEGLAYQHGFHDLTFEAALVATLGHSVTPHQFSGTAARAADEISEIQVPDAFPALELAVL